MSRLLLAAAASCLMVTSVLAGEGARANFLLPADTNIISLTGTLIHTELGPNQGSAFAITPSYRRTIDVGGNAGALLIGIPLGSVSADLDFGGGGIIHQEADFAQGDLFLGAELGLIGSPSLAPIDYAQYQPGFRLGAAAKLFLPTGDYDSTRFTNLGGNRWSLKASLPISYVLADSMIDPAMTTFELLPSVSIFGDNDDAIGPADVVSQAPIWGVEAHVSHSFSRTVWAALDAVYQTGGETTSDGTPDGNATESLALGATLGLVLSPSLALRLSYLEQVYSNVPDSRGRDLQVTAAFRF